LQFKVKSLYDAEVRLVDALAEMSLASSAPALTEALDRHCQDTKQQIARLENVCNLLGLSPDRETCSSIKSMIDDARMVIKADGEDDVRDAALIGICQEIEHHELAAYGTCRTWARHLHQDDIAELLQETLDEEREFDQKLTDIAESFVNVEAAHRL
jgi:ferritin-like metal-binding protein YciE